MALLDSFGEIFLFKGGLISENAPPVQARRSFLHCFQHLHAAFESSPSPCGGFDAALRWALDGAKMVHDALKISYDRLKIAPCWCPSRFPYDVSSMSQQCSLGVL